ncbi:MAG: hypothetical protein ACKVOU_05855 [Cytophagales bacterium]
MKKSLLLLLLFHISSLNIQAQGIPSGMSYQAIARDNLGKELLTKPVTVRFSILSGSVVGTLQYQETHTATTNQFGLFNLIIGTGTPTGAGTQTSIATIDWSGASQFLVVELSLDNGGSYIQAGNTRFVTIPYAFAAKNIAEGEANKLARWDENRQKIRPSNIFDNGNGVQLIGNATITGNMEILGERNFLSTSSPLAFDRATGVISSNISASNPIQFNATTGVMSSNISARAPLNFNANTGVISSNISASNPIQFNASTGVISSNISATAPLSFNSATGIISYNSSGSP